MSDLQIILIILGAFIIAGVLVYNWLQEKKLHKQVSSDFIVPQKDVLVEDFYIDTDAFVEKELAGVAHKDTPSKTAPQPAFENSKYDAEEDFSAKNAQPTEQYQTSQPSQAEVSIARSQLESSKNKEIVFKNKVLEDTILKDSSFEQDTFNQTHSALNANDADHQFVSHSANRYESPEEFADDKSRDSAFVSARTAEKPLVEATEAITPDEAPIQLPADVHPQIDLTAVLYANKNISYQALHDMAASIDDIGLPQLIYGLDEHHKWHLIKRNEALTLDVSALAFKQATCSLQLADRGGPVSKSVLNKFQFAVESMGLDLNAHVEWQGNGDVLQRAIEIDQFCIEVDQLINIHIAQNETPIHGTKFRGVAEASGMLLNDDGKFYYHDSTHSFPLFTAIEANNQAFTAESLRNSVLKAITFQLEIPKVPNCEQAFNQMILIAQKLNTSLNARLVDDNQRPLGDLQIEKIRQQLKVIHATMVARGVMPGSSASMRLFN